MQKKNCAQRLPVWLLGGELGIGHDPEQHAAYVGSWIKVLEEDPKEIFRAAADAEKIKDFVLSFSQQQEIVDQEEITMDQTSSRIMMQTHVNTYLFLMQKKIWRKLPVLAGITRPKPGM